MRLFIMRHGDASFDAPSDAERPLTEYGIEGTKSVVAQALSILGEIDDLLILVSPFLRAQQTADIVAQALDLTTLTEASITPAGNPHNTVEFLTRLSANHTVLMISHQPLLGELVSLLVNGDYSFPHPHACSEILALEGEVIAEGCLTFARQIFPE